jgi:hypothetical protein
MGKQNQAQKAIIRLLKRKPNYETGDKNNFFLLSGIVISSEVDPIELQQFQFNPESHFSSTGYTICNELTKRCHDVGYLPLSKTFVMTDNSFCQLIQDTEEFIYDVALSLDVTNKEAVSAVANFFTDRSILVSQSGLPGYVYKIGTYAQTAGSATMVARTVSFAKMAGVSGLKIIQTQPLLLITLPTVGAMFFHGCGSIAGNNTVGRTCNTIGNTLNLPMSYAESVYNTYASPVINRIFGIPTLLNYTKQARRGPGLDAQEATKLLGGIKKESILKHMKCWVIKKLGGKCS